MYAYNELNTHKGELFIFNNSNEADELVGELIYQNLQFSYDQDEYTGQVFITVMGGR